MADAVKSVFRAFLLGGATFLAALCTVTTAHAQDPRPAPAYLSEMFAFVYAAEALARWCPTYSVNAKSVEKEWLEVFARLETEGYDVDRLGASMRGTSDAIADAVAVWAARRDLTEVTEQSQVCRAAQVEISERTTIGRLLQRSAG